MRQLGLAAAIREGIMQEMRADDNVILLGKDVGQVRRRLSCHSRYA